MNAELFEAHAVLAVRSAFDRPTLVLAGQELGTGLPVALVPEHETKGILFYSDYISQNGMQLGQMGVGLFCTTIRQSPFSR